MYVLFLENFSTKTNKSSINVLTRIYVRYIMTITKGKRRILEKENFMEISAKRGGNGNDSGTDFTGLL